MKISQEDGILVTKKSLFVKGVWCTIRAVEWISLQDWKLESIDSLLKRIRKTVRRKIIKLSGNHAAIDCVRLVAVDDLVLSQEDKPKRHRSARKILHDTTILRLSVHRIIHCDLQLKCFKWRRVRLLSEVNRIFRLTRVCNKFCYCSISNHKMRNKQNNMVCSYAVDILVL